MSSFLECFRHEDDGSWTSTQPISMFAAQGMRLGVSAGRNFKPGELFFGLDLVAKLDAMARTDEGKER